MLALPSGAIGLNDLVPPRKLRDLRLARHRAEAAGGWTTELADQASIGAALNELMRLHQDRWTAADEPGVFADPRVQAFHRAASPDLLRTNMLRLWMLRLGGRVAAAYYVLLADGGRLLFYLCGFDRAWARQSPGTLLLGDIVAQAIRERWRELHFLRGGEAFKYQWGAVEHPLLSRRLVPTITR